MLTLKLAKQIEELERALLTPEVRRDREALDRLLADDLVEFGMYGKIYSKQDFLERLPSSEEEKFERYTASDFEAKELAPGLVMLTYKALIEFLKTNEKVLTLRCSIWRDSGDGWQMVWHQGTVRG